MENIVRNSVEKVFRDAMMVDMADMLSQETWLVAGIDWATVMALYHCYWPQAHGE